MCIFITVGHNTEINRKEIVITRTEKFNKIILQYQTVPLAGNFFENLYVIFIYSTIRPNNFNSVINVTNKEQRSQHGTLIHTFVNRMFYLKEKTFTTASRISTFTFAISPFLCWHLSFYIPVYQRHGWLDYNHFWSPIIYTVSFAIFEN